MKLRLSFALVMAGSVVNGSATALVAQQPATRPARPAVTLHVGDLAPPIRVQKWIKGAQPTSLTDGRVHVVEFWATWCAPCKHGMPHLSAVAKKYGDRVSVSGVSVWEGSHGADPMADPIPKVEAFVTRAGDMMAYNVGADGLPSQMVRTWLDAAGVDGIPEAFVIDQSGRIAWHGHPAVGMERVIDLLLAGKFDAAAARTVREQTAAEFKASASLYEQVAALMKDGKFAEAAPVNERLGALPSGVAEEDCVANRYLILTHTDPPAAPVFAAGVLAGQPNAPLLLAGLARAIITGPVGGDRDYPMARRLLERASDRLELFSALKKLLAEADFKTGNVGQAIAVQSALVRSLENAPARSRDPKAIEQSRRVLDEYQRAGAQPTRPAAGG